MQSRVAMECCSPILRVGDMAASLRFSVDKLGFKNGEWGSPEFTSISRGGATIYVCRDDQGAGKAWVWIGVEAFRQMHAEGRAAGISLRIEPKNPACGLSVQSVD